jgi:hypothetical protein
MLLEMGASVSVSVAYDEPGEGEEVLNSSEASSWSRETHMEDTYRTLSVYTHLSTGMDILI